MKSMMALTLVAALSATMLPAIPEAQAARKLTCQEMAKKGADGKGRERIFKTALMGGTSALLIGAILSNNNKEGKVRAGGAFGGGLIAGKAYKVQWKRDYAVALQQCRRGK